MRQAGTVVWLRAQPETLRTRVGEGGGRRDDATSLDWIQDVVEERSPIFEEAADMAIDVDRLRPRLVVDEIVRRLGIEPDQAEASATSRTSCASASRPPTGARSATSSKRGSALGRGTQSGGPSIGTPRR